MRERKRMQSVARLTEVQRAARAGAEAALAAARARSESAQADERTALAVAEQAQAQWLDLVSAGGFSPEYSRVLAGRLVEREAEADAASVQARSSEELAARREGDWRLAEAKVRASEDRLRLARRRLARRSEEQRLTEVADRTTRAWRRP